MGQEGQQTDGEEEEGEPHRKQVSLFIVTVHRACVTRRGRERTETAPSFLRPGGGGGRRGEEGGHLSFHGRVFYFLLTTTFYGRHENRICCDIFLQ